MGVTPAQAAADTDPPVVVSVDVPSSVTAGESLTATWRITDASGVEAMWVNAYLTAPNGNSLWTTQGVSRISGTDQDSTYEATWAIPAAALDGTYALHIQGQHYSRNLLNRHRSGQ